MGEDAAMWHDWSPDGSTWNGPESLDGGFGLPVRQGPQVPVSSGTPLGSNPNYFIYSPGTSGENQPITGLSITIAVTEDLVAASPTPGHQSGFAFQVNGLSPANTQDDPSWIVWQQYILGVHGGIGGAINNWTEASLSTEQTINGHGSLLATLPTPNAIPAGWVLTISLGNDEDGNVNSVTFTQWSPPDWNKPPVTNTVTLTDLTTTGGQTVTSAYLAPILVLQLLLLGPGDS
jgi:hypothetical protein